MIQPTTHDVSETQPDSRDERFQKALNMVQISMDRAADLIFWTDTDAHILYVNHAACRALGYNREELLSLTMHAINPEGIASKAWPAYWQEIQQHGSLTFETILCTKCGSTFPVEVTANYLEYRGEAYHYAFMRDITARKQAEHELRESERRYRLLAENLSDGVGIIQEMKLQFANSALLTLLDHPQEKLLGKELYTLVREDEREACQQICRELEQGRAVDMIQTVFVRQDQQEIWVEIYPNIIMWHDAPAILGVFRDITEVRQRKIAEAEEKQQILQENLTLRMAMKDRYKFGKIIGKSLLMQQVYELILKAAASDANVIIYGESGTGKELVARTIHDMGSRKEQAFVPVNCGAIPENLFESEFFGHRKGAFTGAYTHKRGLFDLANQGTLFLDEIGELTPTMQVKLLRAIETREYIPLGSTTTCVTDIRIISATHRDFTESLANEWLREDFLYRIHVIPIHLPPLRERKEDIPLLVEHFLEQHAQGTLKPVIPGKILEELYQHDWPGNIRELQNVLRRYITLDQLHFMNTQRVSHATGDEFISWDAFLQKKLTLHDVVQALERDFISNALAETRRNKTKAAEILGIPERTFYRKMKAYNL